MASDTNDPLERLISDIRRLVTDSARPRGEAGTAPMAPPLFLSPARRVRPGEPRGDGGEGPGQDLPDAGFVLPPGHIRLAEFSRVTRADAGPALDAVERDTLRELVREVLREELKTAHANGGIRAWLRQLIHG